MESWSRRALFKSFFVAVKVFSAIQHYIERAGHFCPALSFDDSTLYSCIDSRIQPLLIKAEVGSRFAPNQAPSRGTTGQPADRPDPIRDQPLCQRAQDL